jgi:hypothetical protein
MGCDIPIQCMWILGNSLVEVKGESNGYRIILTSVYCDLMAPHVCLETAFLTLNCDYWPDTLPVACIYLQGLFYWIDTLNAARLRPHSSAPGAERNVRQAVLTWARDVHVGSGIIKWQLQLRCVLWMSANSGRPGKNCYMSALYVCVRTFIGPGQQPVGAANIQGRPMAPTVSAQGRPTNYKYTANMRNPPQPIPVAQQPPVQQVQS